MTLQPTHRVDVPDAATQAWDRLAEQVDALIQAWEHEAEAPDLARFVPPEPAHLRGMLVAELIKVDLEFRWHGRRAPKLVEDYVEQFPELASGGELPCDLIYEEYHVRRQSGDSPTAEDYYQRFPRQVAQLKKLLGLEEPHMTTTMVGSGGRRQELEAGQQLDDFDLLTQLGKGAFAQVFLARQRSMQRLVALKVSSDKGTEGQTLAQLDHPHIVRVYDQRVIKEKRLRLLYMQNIPGGTLQSVVERVRQTPVRERTGKLLLDAIDESLDRQGESPPTESSLRRRLSHAPWPEAVCWLGARMASGLDHAHQHGVLHRDVKPANVLLTADGTPKLADFNVSFSSKLTGSTPAAYFGGSLAYMSPEQLEAADADNSRDVDSLDGRSDMYSLGIVIWELLTGQRPFTDSVVAGNWSATLKQLIEKRNGGIPAETIKQLPDRLPPGLSETLLNCLNVDPANRPASADVFARQLDLCLRPRVQRLLRPSTVGMQGWIKRFPFLIFVTMSLAANAVFSLFNLFYNLYQIIQPLDNATEPPSHDVEDFFRNFQVKTVNGVAYSLGVIFGVALIWPVFRALRTIRLGKKIPTEMLPEFRRRAATIGDRITWVTMALWIPSGIAFPLWISWKFGDTAPMGWGQFGHFVGSNMLCGLLAATQTFFLCTFVAIRYFYPLFIRPDENRQDEDFNSLARLENRSGLFFGAAVSAPFLAIMLLLTIPLASTSKTDDSGRPLMIALAGLGFLGAILAFRLYRAIQSDISALATGLDPNRESSTGTETFESSWTITR